MLPTRKTVSILTFMTLSAGVVANVFWLQVGVPTEVASAVGASSWNLATVEVGATGSIEAPPSGSAGAFELSALLPSDTDEYATPVEVTRAIQRELQIRGYQTGDSSGGLGPMTRAAILAFEHDNDLPATARPTQELLKSILFGVSGKGEHKRAAPTSEAQDVIRSVQQHLARLGYKPGEASGAMNAQTQKAIRAFEADQAMPESGRVSGPLVARLGRLAGGARISAAP